MLSGLALLLLVCLNMRVQGKPQSQVGAASPPLQGPGFNPGFDPPAASGLDHQDQKLLGWKMSIEIVNSDGCDRHV